MRVFQGSAAVKPLELWQEVTASPPAIVGVDTETPSLSDRSLLGLGLAFGQGRNFYITADDDDFPRALRVLRDPAVTKVFHNAPFDVRLLRKYQVDYSNIQDTAIMVRLLGEANATLEAHSWRVRLQTTPATQLMAEYKAKDMTQIPPEAVGAKCCRDAEATLELYHKLHNEVDHALYDVDIRVVTMLETISQKGLALDHPLLDEVTVYYKQMADYYKTLTAGYGFSVSSPWQVGYTLATRGNFLPLTKSGKQLATDDATLSELDDPLAAVVLLYRKYAKMLNTYLVPWADQPRAYTTFHLDAITGRISGTSAGANEPDRNMLNLPKKSEMADVEAGRVKPVRHVLLPDKGEFTKGDASQIELRLLSHLSGDERMERVLRNPDGDIHSDTNDGMEIHNRYIAKVFNFAMIYLANDKTLARQIKTRDYERVAEYRRRWMSTYPGAAAWMERSQVDGLRDGYAHTLFGRKMPIPLDMGEAHARSCSVNFIIQGSAADIFKRMLLVMTPWLDMIRLPVHDELLLDGCANVPIEELARVSPVWTPVKVEHQRRWE